MVITVYTLRLYVIVVSFSLLALFAVMIRRSKRLATTQPDGSLTSNVNMIAYAATMLAVTQSLVAQIIRLKANDPVYWYGTPISAAWESILLVWAVQRARWHRGVEDAARMIQTDGDVV